MFAYVCVCVRACSIRYQMEPAGPQPDHTHTQADVINSVLSACCVCVCSCSGYMITTHAYTVHSPNPLLHSRCLSWSAHLASSWKTPVACPIPVLPPCKQEVSAVASSSSSSSGAATAASIARLMTHHPFPSKVVFA